MIVVKNHPFIVFIRSATSEYSIEIVGDSKTEDFRKVYRKGINTWCRIRVQEGSGRFQEGGPEGHLHIFLLFSVRLCFSFLFLFVFLFCVVVCFSFLLGPLLCVVLSFCVLYVFRFVFMLVLFIVSFLFCVLFSLRYLFYVLDFYFLISVFVCWRLGG